MSKKYPGKLAINLYSLGLDCLQKVLFSVELKIYDFKEILNPLTHCK